MAVDECNELTVKIKCELEKFYKVLENKGFKKIDRFSLDDTFFIRNDLDIKKMTTREILANAVLVRVVERISKKTVRNITFKYKKYDENGNILYQNKVECDVLDTEDAKKLLLAIGYNNLMHIKENDLVYEKDGFQIAVKNIENGDNLVEIEAQFNSEEFNSIEKLKEKVAEYELPVFTDNYFVKKAEIELNKILDR